MGEDTVKITGIDFTGVLQTLGMQKSTGILRVDGKDDSNYFVYIENGRIVGADVLPKRLDERLGNLLLMQGTLRREDLENAMRLQKASKRKLGEILVRYGFVDEDVVKEALKRQIMRIFYRLYTTPIKKYVFDPKEELEDNVKMIEPIPIESFMLEIATIIDELPKIREEIPSETLVFEPSPKYNPADVELISEEENNPENSRKITSVEFHVFNLVDGISPVETILLKSPYSEFKTLKALWSLKKKGFISLSQEETEIATIIKGAEDVDSGKKIIFITFLSTLIILASAGLLYLAKFSPFYTYIKDLSSYFIFK